MYRQRIRLVVIEAVCRQSRTQVHGEIVHRSVTGVYKISLCLQELIYALDDVSSSQHDLVMHGHEFVLHVGLEPMHEMYSLLEQHVEKPLLDIPPVSKHLSYSSFMNTVHTRSSLSSTFTLVRQNVMISPESLHTKCSLKPWHHPIVPLPSFARPSNTLLK